MTTSLTVDMPILHAGQAKVITGAARFNVLECGRRFGKTQLAQNLAADTAIEGYPVGWFAPSVKIMDPAWRELKAMLAGITSKVNEVRNRIELVTGGAIDFWSLDNPNSGRGRFYKRIIVDEASLVRYLMEAWQQTIRPTLTDLSGDAWFLGTPQGHNEFHQLFARGEQKKPGWSSWRLPTLSNPHISRADVQEAKDSLPPAVFAQEYEGIPDENAGNPFGSSLRLCIAEQSMLTPVAFGVDVAKHMDWTVVIGLDAAGVVCTFERWQKADWPATEARILSLVNGWPTLIDSTGVGDSTLDHLQKVRPNIEGFKFTAQSKQQLMQGLVMAIQSAGAPGCTRPMVGYPDGPIVSELESFRFEYTRTGVRYSAPEGLHDDCVCALALAVRKLGQPREWVGAVEVGDSPFEDDYE